MATPRERFVEALKFLQELQDKEGWYIATDPAVQAGETTA